MVLMVWVLQTYALLWGNSFINYAFPFLLWKIGEVFIYLIRLAM